MGEPYTRMQRKIKENRTNVKPTRAWIWLLLIIQMWRRASLKLGHVRCGRLQGRGLRRVICYKPITQEGLRKLAILDYVLLLWFGWSGVCQWSDQYNYIPVLRIDMPRWDPTGGSNLETRSWLRFPNYFHEKDRSSQRIRYDQYPGFPGLEVNHCIWECERMGNYVRDLVPVRGSPQSGPVAPVQAKRCAG